MCTTRPVRMSGTGEVFTADWSISEPKSAVYQYDSASGRQHILPSIVSCFPRIFDRVFGTVGPYQLTALWTVDGYGRPAGGVDARVWLLPVALHAPPPRPLQRIADGGRRLSPRRQPVGGRRVEAGVHRRRRYHKARF